MRLRMDKALHMGSYDYARIPGSATTAVAMFEYFIDVIGFDGDLVEVNVRNTEYLRNAVKEALVSQVSTCACVWKHFNIDRIVQPGYVDTWLDFSGYASDASYDKYDIGPDTKKKQVDQNEVNTARMNRMYEREWYLQDPLLPVIRRFPVKEGFEEVHLGGMRARGNRGRRGRGGRGVRFAGFPII